MFEHQRTGGRLRRRQPNLGEVTFPLNKPVVFGQATSDGQGYWEFAADGGVFTYGDAPFEGSLGSLKLNAPINGAIAFGPRRGTGNQPEGRRAPAPRPPAHRTSALTRPEGGHPDTLRAGR